MMPGHSKVVILTIVLLVGKWLSAGIFWLRIGDATQPAHDANGSILLYEQLLSCTVSVVDETGNLLGTGNFDGLDQVGPGCFAGVVYADVEIDAVVGIRILDSSSGWSANLGTVPLRGDNFVPHLDISHYRLIAPNLTWRNTVTLTIAASPGGTVEGTAGTYPPDTSVQLSAKPNPFYEFIRWEGDIPHHLADQSEVEILLDSDTLAKAIFALQVPDFWLLRHFQTVDVDLEEDYDNDGCSAREEFEFGTDPKSARSSQQSIRLATGWNQVALSVLPPKETLRSPPLANESIRDIVEWNASENRFLTAIKPRPLIGFWVFSFHDVEIEIEGQPVVDPVLRIHSGWNLVAPGRASKAPDSPVVNDRLWLWDNRSQAYRKVVADSALDEGVGLWIFAENEEWVEFPPSGSDAD